MNLRRWLSLDQQERYIESLRDQQRSRELAMERTSHTPGEQLQREGHDEPPTVIRDDEISRAARRLLDLHQGV